MTTIVYDNNAIITDSRVLRSFNLGQSISEHAGKINYNESHTVAWATCGNNQDDSYKKLIVSMIEAELVLAYLIDLRFTSTDREDSLVAGKAITMLSTRLDAAFNSKKFAPANSLIAISRDNALTWTENKSGAASLPSGEPYGIGLYVDAYWLWRTQGLSPAQTFARLDRCSEATGGHINTAPQSSLLEPNYMLYISQANEMKRGDLLPKLQALGEKPQVKLLPYCKKES